MHQAAGSYKASARDWLDAHVLADRLDYLSLSKSSASMVINDRVLTYKGLAYERYLLHAFAAQSYFAQSLWEDAAVEARNLVPRLENRGDFPDDPYSRFVSGFCFEMMRDRDAARVQYEAVNRLLGRAFVDPRSGRLDATQAGHTSELVCFVGIGRPFYSSVINRRDWGSDPHARIYHRGSFLGRSRTLNTVQSLARETEKVNEKWKSAKSAARIVIKEAAVQTVSNEDALAGELLRVFLYGLETPDDRRWKTLPEWLQVARVPCPAGLEDFTVHFVGANGRILESREVKNPVVRKGNTVVSFCRAY